MINLTQPVKGELRYAPKGIISQKFGDNPDIYNTIRFGHIKGHNGVDFWGIRGTPICAAHDGVVYHAYDSGTIAGKRIKIVGKGIQTIYLHNDRLLVHKGARVLAGQQIAEMGNSGSSRAFYMGVHLHFGYYIINETGGILNYNNGYRGAIDPFLCLLKHMRYVIDKNNEQFLLDDILEIALNIGDEEELFKLRTKKLDGKPEKIRKIPSNYLVYPLVSKERWKDLLGL